MSGSDCASSKGNAIRQVEILPNKLLTTAFEASFGCVAVMQRAKRRQQDSRDSYGAPKSQSIWNINFHSLKIDHQPVIIGRGTILGIRDIGRMQNLSKRCDCFLILSCRKCASLNIRFVTVYQEWKMQSLRHVLRYLQFVIYKLKEAYTGLPF